MGVPARTWAQISPAAAELGTQDAGARRVRRPGDWGGGKGVLPNPGRAEDSVQGVEGTEGKKEGNLWAAYPGGQGRLCGEQGFRALWPGGQSSGAGQVPCCAEGAAVSLQRWIAPSRRSCMPCGASTAHG